MKIAKRPDDRRGGAAILLRALGRGVLAVETHNSQQQVMQ